MDITLLTEDKDPMGSAVYDYFKQGKAARLRVFSSQFEEDEIPVKDLFRSYEEYVATSGLIVHPKYQGQGLAKRIKHASFTLARLRWPKAKIFSLTSGAAVMKMNTELGYVPVTFNELTDDESFWKGCEGCINHEILMAKKRKFCICTAMLYDPALHTDDKVTNF
jgi:GNAT superfamily N-acetyltransferase